MRARMSMSGGEGACPRGAAGSGLGYLPQEAYDPYGVYTGGSAPSPPVQLIPVSSELTSGQMVRQGSILTNGIKL